MDNKVLKIVYMESTGFRLGLLFRKINLYP